MPYVLRNWSRRGQQPAATRSDYLDDPDPSTLLRDPRFQREYREMRKRQLDGENADKWTEDELIRDFYQHQTWVNNNSVAAAIEYGRSAFATDAQKQRMARIQRAYELAPTRSISDGTAWADWASSTLIDPLNIIPIGKGGSGAWQAAKAGKGVGGAALAGFKSGGAAGMVEGAVSEFLLDAINQSRFDEVGLQDGYSFGRAGVATGGGALFGGGIGGTLGGTAAAFGARGLRRLADEARPAMSEEAFARLTREEAVRARPAFPELTELRRQQAEAEAAPPVAPTAPDEPTAATEPAATDPIVARANARAAAEAQLDELMRDGADPSQIRQAERNVAAMIALQRIDALNASFDKNTLDTLLASDDAAKRAQGAKNTALYVRLNAIDRRIQADPSAATLRWANEEIDKIEAETAPPPAPDAAAPAADGAAPSAEPAAVEPTPAPEPAAPAPKRGRGKKAAAPAEPEPTPEAVAANEAEAIADPTSPRAEPEDDDALDAFDAITSDMEMLRGNEQYRDIFEIMVRDAFPDLADRVMATYDARYNNPNGMAAEAWAKLQAENKAKETPARKNQRRAAKGGDVGSKAEMARGKPDPNKSIIDQLIEQNALGKLGVAPEAARARENAASAAQKRAIDNAKQTPTEQVRNPARSGTGRAADTLAEGPTTAGQNDRGRPQAILKPGQATERDPISGEVTRTVTDGPAPQRSTLSLDEFKLEAQRNAAPRTIRSPDGTTRETEAIPVAPWTARSDMTGVIGGTTRRWTTKKGRAKVDTGYVPKGTTVYYAPQTDRFYLRQRDALEAIGRAEPRRFRDEAPATPEPTPATPDPADRIADDYADVQAAMAALKAGEITPTEFREILRAFKAREASAADSPTAKRAATVDAATPAEAPAGSVLAIRSREDPSKVRVLTPAQAALGQGVSTLLGKADPDKWEVGYVPAGTKSGSKAAQDGFTPDADFETRVEAITEAEAAQADADSGNVPMPLKEASSVEVDPSSFTSEELEAINNTISILNAQRPANKRMPRVARDTSGITPLLLNALTEDLQVSRWPKSRRDAELLMDTLEGMNALNARIAPNGIERSSSSKAEAIERLETIFAAADSKSLAAMREFIEALSSKRAPNIVKNEEAFYEYTWDPKRDNRVSIGDPDRNPVARGMPAQILYHEVAHWAYANILTPAERQEFWATIARNYYDGQGAPDIEAIRARSAPTDVAANAMDSPQEFFANQFMAWATTRRFADTWEDAPFWERFIEKIRAMLRSFLDRDFVDPDLEHLFERIVPPERVAEEIDSPIRTFAPLSAPKPLKRTVSEFSILHINEVSALHNDIKTALATGNAEAAVNAARDLTTHLYKLTGSDTFAPIKRGSAGNYSKMIRSIASKMSKALNLDIDEARLAEISASKERMLDAEDGDSDFFEQYDLDVELADDPADIWLREGGHSIIKDPEEVMEAIRDIFGEGEDGSITHAVEIVTGALNMSLKRFEGWAFPERTLPTAYAWRNRRRAAGKAATAKEKVAAGVAKSLKQRKRADEKTKKEAIAKATSKPKPGRPKATKETGAPADTSTKTRDLSTSDLLKIYRDGDKATQSAVARELLRRQKTEPDTDWSKTPVTVPRDVMAMRLEEMDAALRSAIAAGDAERINQIFYESWRRGEKRRLKAVGSVSRMILAESEQSRGISDDGIMPGAPVFVREIQSYMSHREPEVQDTMRTLTYRALALMGKTMQRAMGEVNVLTTGEIYRLANRARPINADSVFADFRGEAFNGLRSDLRRMAIGLTKDVSDPFDVMHEIHHLALRTNLFSDEDRVFIGNAFTEAARGNDPVAASRLEKYAKGKTIDDLTPAERELVAEEWFAESGALYAMGKVARGDMFAVRDGGNMRALSGKSKLVEIANRLIEAVAYMANGLMGRRTMKQMFRRLDGYGDMFESVRSVFRRSDDGVPAEYAKSYYSDLMASQPDARLDKMRRFIRSGAGLDERGNPIEYYHGTPNGVALSARDVVMGKGGGNEGEGIYLSLNPKAAQDVYAERGTRKALEAMVLRGVDEGNVDINDVDDAMLAISYLADTRREINFLRMQLNAEQNELANLRRDPSRTARQNMFVEHKLSRYERRLEEAIEYEQNLRSYLEDLGVRSEPKVLGLVIRAENPADFRQSKEYAPTDPFVTNLITDLEEQGLVEFSWIRQWYADWVEKAGRSEIYATKGGRVLYDDLVDILEIDDAASALNRVLGARGYDAVQHSFRNTLSDGTPVSHEGVVLIDHIDQRTGKTVSASSKLKSVEASEFDDTSEILYASLVDRTPSPTIGIINHMAEGRADMSTMAAEVIARLEGSGAPKDFTSTVTSMVRGRAPALRKTADVMSKAFHATLSATSRRLELAGMNTIADWHRLHHVEQANLMGDRVYAIRDALKELPDNKSALGRWLENSWKPRKQPESHARIFKALRMGLESPAAKRLNDVEMEAARKIRGLLDAEFRELRKAGVIVGRVENYMPQIWDTEALQRDPETFVNDLTDYFMAEASRDGRPETRARAAERAQGIWERLISDEGHYLPPPVGSSRSVDSDHIRYQRLIRLEDPEFALNSERLGKFLVNDLESTLIKYFDGSTRSILQNGRFGTLNHAYYDYLRVMDEGVSGIAALLSTSRVARREMKALNAENGYVDIIEHRDEIPMPFSGREFEAQEAAQQIVEMYQTQGRDATRSFLMSLDVSGRPRGSGDTFVPQVKSTYEHRVDAILDALQDGGGKRGAANVEDIQLAQTAMQVALRKKVAGGPGNGDLSVAASRGIRTFNSVSLLSFTVLTSLPDVVLPLIRSGKISSSAQAWSKYMRDPEYREAVRRTGVAIESIVHGHMSGLFATDMSGKLGRLNNRFFNATGLTPWTDMQREIAGATGFEAFRADINRAIAARVGDGSDMSIQTPDYKRTMRRLRAYGLDSFVRENRALSQEDLADPAVKRAVVQFANESIFAPSPDEIPLWAQTPWGAVIFQLKSYPLMLQRQVGQLLGDTGGDIRRAIKNKSFDEIDPTNLKRLGYLLAVGPAFAAASLGIKDIVMMRGGEDNREAELRVRSGAKALPGFTAEALGYDPDTHGEKSDFIGWYIESLMALGGLGLLADLLHATVENADNGAYGQTRQVSAILGPGVGDIGSASIITGGILDSDETSNAKERAAWREAIRRIPVMGGIGSVREGAVDALAGEAE